MPHNPNRSYLIHQYALQQSDMPPFTDNRANALIVRRIDAEYEPSSSATIDEHRIYDSAQLMRITTHATPGLEHQTQQHLAFALHAAETEGDPIIPDTVTPLTTRVGRTVIRAMTASGKTEVMRILAQSKISLDAFTKIQAHRQLFMDADLALPELQTGAVLTTWVPHGSNLPQTEILGYQIQSFEGDGVTWQDVIDGCQSEPDRQEARIEAYTEIGRIMLKLQGTTVRSPAHTGIPYGQYGTATTGEIRAWEDFSRYLNHTMGLHEFVQSAVNIAELPIKLDAKLINRAMYTIRQELLCATMVPHLVHGDLQPSNVLRNGMLIDPDYMSYGNTWNELAKPFGRIIQNHAASLALQQGLHHGLGLSKKQCDIALGDAKTGILFDCLDRLTYTLLSITEDDAVALQNWDQVKAQQQKRLQEISRHKSELLISISKLSQHPDSHSDKEYLRDYIRWAQQCDQDTERVTQQYSLLEQKINKINAVQQEMRLVFNEPSLGHPAGWRDARREDVISRMNCKQTPPRTRSRLHAELGSLWPSYPLQ